MDSLIVKIKGFKIIEIPLSQTKLYTGDITPNKPWNGFIMAFDNNLNYGLYGPIDNILCSLLRNHILPYIETKKEFNILSKITFPQSLIRHQHYGYHQSIISVINIVLTDLYSKQNKIKVSNIFGKNKRSSIPFYVSILNEKLNCEEIYEIIKKFNIKVPLKISCPIIKTKTDLLLFIKKINNLHSLMNKKRKIIVDFKNRLNTTLFIFYLNQSYKKYLFILEEPFIHNDFDSYLFIKNFSNIKIASGEHCYSLLDFKNILRLNILSYIQPEINWCGGIVEFNKIIEFAELNKVQVIPHGGGLSSSLHLSLNYSNQLIPLIEYNFSSEYLKQAFLTKNIKIDNHKLYPSKDFGLGVDFLPHIKEKYLKL